MHSLLPVRMMRSLAILIPAIVLAACGNGSGQTQIPATPQPELTGALVDSPIAGANWTTLSGKSGLTNNAGEFQYTQLQSGSFADTVTFAIGDIVLGTAPGARYITSVELTNSFAPTDRAALNQLVFLQSIDADGNPANGITVSAATRAAAIGQTLDFDAPDFDTRVASVVAAITEPDAAVVSESAALDHFYTTYAALGGTDTFAFSFPGYPPVGAGEDVFTLIFADEFDTGTAPDPSIWNVEQGYGPNNFGWGNNEWQLYTNSPDNLRVEDGNLVITALCPDAPCGVRDGTITSARITTTDKFEFRYGKIVARIKPPVGQATWPAFWALGANFPEIGWPRSGEIDFMEVFNNTYNTPEESDVAEKTATSAMHWCNEFIVTNPQQNCFPDGRIFTKGELTLADSLANDFQIWEANWTPDSVTVAINGIQYYEQAIDPATMEEFRRDFFLLLNVAIGGTLGSGQQPPQGDELLTPQTMLVDFVRVYQQIGDISPPELTAVTIASSNADPGFATTGDVVTVTLTTNEPILAPVVTIGGTTATTVTGSGTSWQASRTLTAEDANGVIGFTVEYTDLAGNAGVSASESTDSSDVTADSATPTLSSVTIVSNNVDPSLAKAGDVVTVTLNASEVIMPPMVTISGAAATVTGSGANWTATRTLMAGDAQGTVAFSIEFADFAANAGVPVTMSTDASSVTLDTAVPTVAVTGAPATFASLASFGVSIAFSESVTNFDLSGIQVTNGAARNLAGSGASYTADVTPNGLGNLVVRVAAGVANDAAGNLNEASADVSVTGNLNPDAPLLQFISITSSNSTDPGYAREGDVVTINMTASEAITQPTVTIAGAPAVVTGADDAWQATRTIGAVEPEGLLAFEISNFQDLGGDPGFLSSVTTDDSTVIIDVTPPTLSIAGLPAVINSLDPIQVAFQFDEAVNGFAAGDIAVSNGVASAFAVVDAATYTTNIAPDGTGGDLTVSVAADAVTDVAGNGNAAVSVTSVVEARVWELVWSDDFDGAGLNAANWTARTDADCPDPCAGVQSYLSERVSVANGLLTIEARDEGGSVYTSGLIDTRDKLSLKYGRIEIDARMPGTLGTLPSLFLLPASETYGPFPQSGEIDIVNAPNLGPGNSALEHTLRYGLPEPEDTATTATTTAPGIPTLDLIEYAIEWEGGEIRWFVNDVQVATQTQANWYAYFEDADGDGIYDADGAYTLGADGAPFDEDFYLAIGLAVGSNADSFFPQTLEIDAVRVFECANPTDPALGNGCSTGTGVPAIDAPDTPYTEMLELYTDAPATLAFVQPDGVSTDAVTLNLNGVPGDPSNSVISTIDALDGANTVWNADIQAVVGGAFVVIDGGGFSPNPGESLRRFDLSGGETAGEVLFRLRVNSASPGVQLFANVGDRQFNDGQVPLDFVADGQWRNYSVKIADVVASSLLRSGLVDISDVLGISFQAFGGSVNFDLDDISVKVACRDNGGCEATPRSAPAEAVVEFTEDFESFDVADPFVLGDAGWQIFGAVFDAAENFLFGYGAFPAPNNPSPPGWAALVTDQGGVEQGGAQLSVFSDYQCCQPSSGHFNGTDLVESNIFLEWTIGSDGTYPSLNTTVTVSFDAKRGNIEGTTTAIAFLKTLDPNAGFATTNFERVDTTDLPDTWGRYTLTLDLTDPLLVGQLLQIGFASTTSAFAGSGVFYDNIEVSTLPASP